jgi:hypothetical protein
MALDELEDGELAIGQAFHDWLLVAVGKRLDGCSY